VAQTKVFLLALAIAVGLFVGMAEYRFFEIDDCLDAGGLWEKDQCVGVEATFVPLSERRIPLFWLLMAGSSVAAAASTFAAMSALQRRWQRRSQSST
jgi:hypothetical protein